MSLYDALRRGADGAVVEVSRFLKEALDCEARSLQQSIYDVVRGAVEETPGSLTNAPVAIDKKLRVIVSRTAGTDESARPGASSSHTARSGEQAGASSNCPSFGHGPRKEAHPSATFNSPGALDPRDHYGYDASITLFVM